MPRTPPFAPADLAAAMAQSTCWADALRFLGYVPKGGNYKTLKRWAGEWGISSEHFDPHAGRRRAGVSRTTPLEEVLVQNSPYRRGLLKSRLLAAGIKERRCELCGQGELWRGTPMALVLDHINGVSNDHRLVNLRIVCPNCAATFDTHCGRNLPQRRECAGCGRAFSPRNIHHRYCSMDCWGVVAAQRYAGVPHPERRKVPRPSYEQLMTDLQSMTWCAVGRKYGVTDNAVRKWVRFYERQRDQTGEREEDRRDLAEAA